MRKSILKSLISIVFAIILLIGCSTPQSTDSTNETSTSETEVKETVAENIENKSVFYRGTQRTLTTTLDGIDKYSIQDEKILGLGYVKAVKDKEATISYYLTSWEENWREQWEEEKQIELPFTTVNYTLQCNGLDIDSEGNIYIILTDTNKNCVYFLKVDAAGEIVLNCDIKGSLSAETIITGMVVGNDRNVYLEASQERIVYGLDAQGTLLGTYQLEEGRLWDLLKDNENKVHLVTEKKNQLYLCSPIESETVLFESGGQGIAVNRYMNVYEGIDNNFFVTTPNGLISYDAEKQTTTQLIDWLSAGVSYASINYVGVMQKDEEQIITVLVEKAIGSKEIDIYTFINVDESESEKLILATLNLKSELRNQIVSYNKLHPDFPIEIRYYEDSEEGLRKLNTDLLTGSIIDIIDANSLSHLTSLDYYAEQGLLEDIGAWLEADETIDETDFVQSVLEANKIDGVLYNFVPSFTVETFSGAQSVVGDDFVWTVEEAMNYLENNPECSLYSIQNKKKFVTDICRYNGAYLVNEEEGTCHFDSEAFIQLLTYANTLQEYNHEVWKVEQGYADDYIYHCQQVLCKDTEFRCDLALYLGAKALFEQGMAQDMVSFVGFPMIDENETNGSVFVNLISISMASTSQKKEKAWGFFQHLLSDYYQNDERDFILGTPFLKQVGFPIKNSSIQRIFAEEEQKELYGGFGYVDKWTIETGPLTQEDLVYMNDFLSSINRLAWENEILTNIVVEEAQYYFSGECTAEEAAQRMQSRVELYLMEKE